MRQIVSELVWIGNARDIRDVKGVLDREIAAVVQLAIEEPPVLFPREIIYCRFPLLDGEGNPAVILRTVVIAVSNLIEAKIPTLVGCSGGMSRSPSIVASALAYSKGESPEEWLLKTATAGVHDIAPALWNDLRNCFV